MIETLIEKFEDNFYIRVLFLGRSYENYLKNEIEMNDNNSSYNMTFTDFVQKEQVLLKKLSKSSN